MSWDCLQLEIVPFPGHTHLPFDMFACDYVCRVVNERRQCSFQVQPIYQAPRYKTFFMLNSTEHEISATYKKYFALNLSAVVFIMLINVKMPTFVGFLTFMSMIILCSVKLSMNNFLTLGLVLLTFVDMEFSECPHQLSKFFFC